MKDRAKTFEDKLGVMMAILAVWNEKYPDLRLGQMLVNLSKTDVSTNEDSLRKLFYIEDLEIVRKLIECSSKEKEKPSKQNNS